MTVIMTTKNSVYQIEDHGRHKYRVTKLKIINPQSTYFSEGEEFWVNEFYAIKGQPGQLGTISTSIVTNVETKE